MRTLIRPLIESSRLYVLSTVSVILLISTLIYFQTLDYSFHFDDYHFIVLNSNVHDLVNVKQIWKANSLPVRFVTFWTFALNHHFGGLDVRGYHVFNIVVHTLNGLLVCWLMNLFFLSPYLRKQSMAQHRRILAVLAGLIFLTHPLQTQAVTYICQRFASLATMFYLLSFCLYLQARVKPLLKIGLFNFLPAVVVAIIGMFTKQIVFTLPIMLIVCEFLFFEKKRFSYKGLIAAAAFLIVIPVLYKFDFKRFLDVSVDSRSHIGDTITWWSYLITQPRVVVQYLRLLFFPLKQNLDYDFMVSQSIFDGRVIGSLICIIALFVTAFKLRDKQRLITFGILWFFITISIESSIFPLQQVIFEHRCYLPMFGFTLVLLGLAAQLMTKPIKRYCVLLVIILCFTFLSFQRNQVWENEITLWTDVTKKSESKSRAYVHLGTGYLANNQNGQALTAFSKALELNPSDYKAYNNRALAYQYMGNLKMALSDFLKAVEHSPQEASYGELHNNIGNIFFISKDYDKALEFYNKALGYQEDHQSALLNRANVYIVLDKTEDALKDLNELLRVDPDHLKALQIRADLNYKLKYFDQALIDYGNILRLNPEDNLSYANRSIIFNQRGEYQKALDEAQKAKMYGAQVDERYIDYLKKTIRQNEFAN